jgi:guanylate kinase
MTLGDVKPLTGFEVVVLSGPSGSGKTTIVERLIAAPEVKLLKAVSATTRPPRAGEKDGDAYYFLTQDEFDRKKGAGEFLETAEVYGVGYWYGTLKSELERARQAGAWSLLEIDVQGALKVMELYPDAITIFLKTPSAEVYEQRLRGRGTEDPAVIERRLKRASEEVQLAERYRYQVVNDNLDRAVNEILGILKSQ